MHSGCSRWLVRLTFVAVVPAGLHAEQGAYSFESAQALLGKYCRNCHAGKSPAGGFDLQEVGAQASLRTEAQRWGRIQTRVRIGEMPPRGLPAPTLDQREQF